MWSRLKIQTDNELIRLRFYGNSGIYLHVFRATFLAFFVIPLFASFIILALRKLVYLLPFAHGINPDLLLIGVVLLLVLKNSFHQKIRTDLFNACICLIAPIIICFFLLKAYGGPSVIYGTLNGIAANEVRLIPNFVDSDSGETMANLLVFFFIQWWSVNIVDNSDPNAQRHLQAKSQYAAFKALFFPILLTSFMFLFVSTIWDCGLLAYKQGNYAVVDKEAFYLQIALQHLPAGFRAIALMAIVFSLITTLESIINWGGGLLTIDIWKRYIYYKGSDTHYRYSSFLAMILVSVIALIFAYNSDQIIALQKFVFSISAGVAPVFLLRWFWWRINAWTQITAMLSSLVYTLTYDYLFLHNSGFRQLIETLCTDMGLSPFPLKLALLTFLVVLTWLMVMFATKPDKKEHLVEFVRQTGTGGLWPQGFPDTGYRLKKRLLLCVLLAVTSILPFLFIWQFKFGSFLYGAGLLSLFIGLACYVYKAMSTICGESTYAKPA
jgi:Na+/proline symporter